MNLVAVVFMLIPQIESLLGVNNDSALGAA